MSYEQAIMAARARANFHIADINEALQAAEIVTVPESFPQLCARPKTDEAVHQFLTDFSRWRR